MSTLESPSWASQHAAVVWSAAAFAGPLAAGLLTPFRPSLDGSHVALVLVLVVAAVSAAGLRGAGIVAAVTTGLAFDYFWTQPYGSLTIGNGADIATGLLLVAVGVAIEQLSWWGRRQHAEAVRRQSYLQTLRLAAGAHAGTGEGDAHLDAVSASRPNALPHPQLHVASARADAGALSGGRSTRTSPQRLAIPFSMPEMKRRCRAR